MVADCKIPRHNLLMRHKYRVSGQDECGHRIADMNMRDILMIVRPLTDRPIGPDLQTTRNRVRVVFVIKRIFDAIQSYDRRLSCECASDYHAERGNRSGKLFGPQSINDRLPRILPAYRIRNIKAMR